MVEIHRESPYRKLIDLAVMGGLILLGAGLALVVATFTVDGQWYFGLALILAVPALLILQKYPLLALAIWFLITPLIVETNSMSLRLLYWVVHRALPPAALIILAVTNMLKIGKLSFPRPSIPEWSALGYIAVGLISIFYLNDNPRAAAIHYYDRVFIPVCLYVLARLLVPGKPYLGRFMLVLMFILVSQSLIGLISWVAPQVLPNTWTHLAGARTTGSLGSYSVFAATVLCMGVILLHYGQSRGPGFAGFVYTAMFPLAMFMDFMSFSRGAWLAGLAVCAGLGYVYTRYMARLTLTVIPIIVIVGALGVFSGQISFAQDRLNSHSTALDRLPVFYAAVQMFLAKPLFGWGYGNFDRYDRQFQGRVFGLVSPQKDHASHNVYLTLLAEQGLIGTALFLMPVIWWMIQSFKQWPRLPASGLWSRKFLAVLWLCILAHFVVNNFSNMRVVVGLGIWWIVLGLMAAMLTPPPSPPRTGQEFVPRPKQLDWYSDQWVEKAPRRKSRQSHLPRGG